MKATICALVPGILLGPTTSNVMAKEKKKMPGQGEMMKRWQEAMTPGDKKLEPFAGVSEAEQNMWMAGPSGQQTVSSGTAEYTMAPGYLRQEVSGDMMGQVMNGVAFTGFDNFRKKYIGGSTIWARGSECRSPKRRSPVLAGLPTVRIRKGTSSE